MDDFEHFFDDDNEVRYISDFSFDIDTLYPDEASPEDIFAGLTHELRKRYAISKGVLIVRQPSGTRYIVVASMTRRNELRRLSLLLPTESSLFEIAAEDGQTYTENFFGLFSGNNFEKNLLLDKQTESFMLLPIKFDGRVVALIGYSSDNSDAFVTFGDDLLAGFSEQFGRRIVTSFSRLH